MSKRESISRYNLIIKKLRKTPASFNEISDYLKFESELQSYNYNVSLRTFQRDLEDIRSIYNIDIRYSKTTKVYFIEFDDQPEVTERILEAFDTFNALNISDRLSNYIHFNKRRASGTENLYGLLHAIKTKVQISFTYEKYNNDEITQRNVEPYAVKESRHRWYVIAYDLNDKTVKSFALDRLTNLEISRRPFQQAQTFDVSEYYRHSFGIIGPDNMKPQDIILEFNPYQGKYIKSLPLHESQKIISDTSEGLTVHLRIIPTLDFVMELLSMGMNVKVIKPKSLVKEVCEIYKKALQQYNV